MKKGFFLHWKVSGSKVNIAVEGLAKGGAAQGWIAVAFSESGKMSPSDAIIGHTTASAPVGAYDVVGYAAQDIRPSSSFSIGDSSLELSDKRVIMRFSRSSGDGGVAPVDLSGENTLVWAHTRKGGDKELIYHKKKRGSIVVDFSCVGKASSSLDASSSSSDNAAADASTSTDASPRAAYPGASDVSSGYPDYSDLVDPNDPLADPSDSPKPAFRSSKPAMTAYGEPVGSTEELGTGEWASTDDDEEDDDDEDDDYDSRRGYERRTARREYYRDQRESGNGYWMQVGRGIVDMVASPAMKAQIQANEEQLRREREAYNSKAGVPMP